jgi:hypothetical protein
MSESVIELPTTASRAGANQPLVGRCFLHPAVDYLVIGGGLTIPLFALLFFVPALGPFAPPVFVFLLINGAHFAASTIRLYTKPDATRDFPLLSWAFPGICLAVAGLALYWPSLGRNLSALYFSWSPYHYAAQAYGLAVMYAMRSGAQLDERDKRQLWLVCLVPFVYGLLTSPDGGLSWFVTREQIAAVPLAAALHGGAVSIVSVAVLALPFSLFWLMQRTRARPLPVICLLILVTNGIWWLTTDYLSAFWWATALHSLQYLAIAMIQFVKERMAADHRALGRFHRPAFHALWFYGLSFALGGGLFFVVPALVYVPLGFDAAQSFWIMAVVINLHHFIVDGFVWRRKPNAPPLRLSAAAAD